MAETQSRRITIGFKLISIISLLLAFALAGIILLASYFFRLDNEVRVKENSHKLAEVLAMTVRADFEAIAEKATGFMSAAEGGGGAVRERFFDKNRDVLYVALLSRAGERVAVRTGIANPVYLGESGSSAADVERLVLAESEQLVKGFASPSEVFNVSPGFRIPVAAISVPYAGGREGVLLVVFVRLTRFIEAVSSPGITHSFIVANNGDLIADPDENLVIARANMRKLPIMEMLLKTPVDNGQTRYLDGEGLAWLGSFKKVPFGQLGVISTVLEEKAFEAVYAIQRRNMLLTILVLNLAILIVYFFSKSLTRPIKALVRASYMVRDGQFELDLRATTRDEIGELTSSFVQMANGLAERERMKDAFGKFVNKDIAEQAMRGELKLGGERKTATIFFSDIRSFTAISEKLDPEQVVEFLNQYMTRMVQCVNDSHGVVDKYIGDAIMAVWGAPTSYGNDAVNAVNGALAMRVSLLDFNRDRGGPGKPIIKIGSGLNSGPVIAGQIGSSDRMEYTVIGDAVNLASRIEALNKPFGTDILVSQDTYALIRDEFDCVPMQKIKVKGKEQPQQIYAVLGRLDDPSRPKDLDALRALIGVDMSQVNEHAAEAKEEKFEILGDPPAARPASPPAPQPVPRAMPQAAPRVIPPASDDDGFRLVDLDPGKGRG